MHYWRYDLHTSIVDLCMVLKPHLMVIDGTRVLSTNGPHGPGKVLQEKTVIASREIVAADAFAVSAFEWYGQRYKPTQLRHIRKGHERGLGRMDADFWAPVRQWSILPVFVLLMVNPAQVRFSL